MRCIIHQRQFIIHSVSTTVSGSDVGDSLSSADYRDWDHQTIRAADDDDVASVVEGNILLCNSFTALKCAHIKWSCIVSINDYYYLCQGGLIGQKVPLGSISVIYLCI